MLPTKYDLNLYRGDNFTKEFKFYDQTPDGTKIPVDFTGLSAKCQVRESSDLDAKLVFEFTVSINANSVTITAPPELTNGLEAGSYVWDMQVGDVTKLFGKIKIIGDITR